MDEGSQSEKNCTHVFRCGDADDISGWQIDLSDGLGIGILWWKGTGDS